MKKIVTAGDRFFLKFPDTKYFQKRAQEADAEIFECRGSDDESFRTAIRDADALIVLDRKTGPAHMDVMEQCRVILALQIGYNCVDVAAATERGIVVANVPAYCVDEVANHTIMFFFALQKNLRSLILETGNGGWSYKAGEPAYTLEGRTFGIVGLGRIGRRVAAKMQSLGVNLISYDPYLHDDIFELAGVERCYELDELLSRSDYVSLHVPLNDETFHLIGPEEIEKMKRGAKLINTCRGGVVDTQALVGALDKSLIAGAALDVLEQEPPDADDPVLSHPRITVTPHSAWYSEESMDKVKEQGMDEVVRVLQGKRPWYAVNPEVLFRGRRKEG